MWFRQSRLTSSELVYAQVEAALASGIADGTFPPGSRLPPEDSLIERFAVSRTTMRIQRVRLADGVPLSFDETYLPRELGEKVIQNDLETEPIFSLLEQKYEVPLVEAEYRLEAVSAEPAVAQALGIRGGSPIFQIERTSYCAGHRRAASGSPAVGSPTGKT